VNRLLLFQCGETSDARFLVLDR